MLVTQTKDKLISLKLNGFIEVLDECQRNQSLQTLNLDEALGLMVDREIALRQTRRQERLLKNAKLRHPNAAIESINYQLPRKFNQQQFRALYDTQWLSDARNIIFIGPTGVGKSYLACALASLACRKLMRVRYYRVSRLTEALRIALADGSYARLLESLAKVQLLILDDWGIDQLDRVARRNMLEVLEDRCGRTSTLITTQLPIEQWHDFIGDSTIADAICDRLISQAYTFTIQGESMRNKKVKPLLVDQPID